MKLRILCILLLLAIWVTGCSRYFKTLTHEQAERIVKDFCGERSVTTFSDPDNDVTQDDVVYYFIISDRGDRPVELFFVSSTTGYIYPSPLDLSDVLDKPVLSKYR